MSYPATAQPLEETVHEPTSVLSITHEQSNQFGSWRDYIGVTKIGITGANLFTTFVGLWLASHGHPHIKTLIFALLGSTLVIAGACSLNNFIDKDIDRHMTRTRHRALVQGRLDANAVFLWGLFLSLSGLIILACLTTVMASIWSFVGLITYVCIYTLWLKRTSPWSTAIGGIAGAVPPVIGWTAVTGHADLTAWALFLFMFLWQPPHFYALAMKRTEEYRAAGIPLLPVVKGFQVTKQKILQWTIVMVPETFLFYIDRLQGFVYLAVAIVFGLIYIVYAIKGLYEKDEIKWAKKMFKYSLIYMNVLFLMMILNLP